MAKVNASLQTLSAILLPVLKSQRVIMALAAVLVGVITLLIPELQSIREVLVTVIVTVALVLIGGFSIDEAARAGKASMNHNQEQLRDLIKELLSELLEELTHEEKEEEASHV